VQELELLGDSKITFSLSFTKEEHAYLTSGGEEPLSDVQGAFTGVQPNCPGFTGKAHLVTYASDSFWDRAQTYVKEAEATGFFESVRVYTPEMLPDTGFQTACDVDGKEHMHFTWKPFVILHALESLPAGDVLVYLDVGCTVNPHGRERFREYIKSVACGDGLGVMGFQIEARHTERKYTKWDVLDHLGVTNNETILDSAQIAGGLQVVHRRAEAIAFMRRWSSLTDTAFLWDDSESQKPNDPTFVAHRHDQSLFSILMKQAGGVAIPDETYPPGHRQVPFWTTRAKTGCRSVEEAWGCT
jgi:hypothetical protein